MTDEQAQPQMASGVRRCYVCPRRGTERGCSERRFLLAGEPEAAAGRCAHGPLVREPNRPYNGKAVPQ